MLWSSQDSLHISDLERYSSSEGESGGSEVDFALGPVKS